MMYLPKLKEWYDDYDENYEEADENDSDNIDEGTHSLLKYA
jgi:hypothetical protein